MGRNEFFARELQRFKRQIALLAGSDPQGRSERRDDKASNCRQTDSVTIHEAATAPDISSDDLTDMGVLLGAVLAAFLAYALLKKWR